MPVDTDAEVFRLRALLRDLVALSAIPGGWIGKEPNDVAAGLADVLVGLLQLDFAFVRLCDPGRAEAVDVTRGEGWSDFPEWLEGHVSAGGWVPGKEIVPSVGDGSESSAGIAIPIGVSGEGGMVAASCERDDFPNEMDELLLSLAANQAATAFQSARLIHDRTAELRRSEGYLARLVDEQAALRRVATLVASDPPPAEVFAKVAEEVARVIGGVDCALARVDGDTAIITLAAWGTGPMGTLPAGERLPVDGTNVVARVLREGRPCRIEDYYATTGTIGQRGRQYGICSAAGAPIVVRGEIWGVVAVAKYDEEPLVVETEARVAQFTDLVATAIVNAETRSALIASRARLVAASDEARQRFERDLHDGVQQRLVGLALKLASARSILAEDQSLASDLAELDEGLGGVLEDLRELSHGIHPAILTQGGLDPAIRALARRSGVPVVLDLAVDGRMAEPVEVAVYYVVSEALTNAAKHARSSRAEVMIKFNEGTLEVRVRDDGVGGAQLVQGSGLAGLRDRVEALGGTIAIKSPVGEGTSVSVCFDPGPASLHTEAR